MSNLIFPAPAAAQQAVGWPVKKTPRWNTIVQPPASGKRPVTIGLQQYPLYDFELDFSLITGDFQTQSSALAQLIGFYNQMNGQAKDWLYLDPFDNTVTNAIFGYGDGATMRFPLARQVGNATELIQVPKGNVSLFVDGVQSQQLGVFVGTGPYTFNIGYENLLLQSEQLATTPWFTGAAFGGTAPTVINGATTGPDGLTDASSISFPSSPGAEISSLSQQFPGFSIAGDTVCFSIWLKVASGTAPLEMVISDGVAQVGGAGITVTSTWTRFSVSFTYDSFAGSAGQGAALWYTNSASAKTIFAWGAQVERNPNGPGGYLFTSTQTLQPNGTIAFLGTAPPLGSKLTWSGNFYYRCRFLEDSLQDLQEFLFESWELGSLKFRSVIL